MFRVSACVLTCVAGLLTAATGVHGAPAGAPASVTIAYQYGYAYAPLIVMKENRVLEKQFPQTRFLWSRLASGAAIRDGMIAGQIQIGAGGVAPFLVGWDKGVGWKVLASLGDIDMWLVARDPTIKGLKDFRPGMKIGMPGLDSIQAIVLRKAAQEQLGNAHALDNDIVAIAHPLGVAALRNDAIAAHFGNPPFQFEEVAQGGHVILKSFDVFGVSTLDSVFATESFASQFPAFAQTFYQEIVSATDLIRRNPGRAAELLSREDGKVSAGTYKGWLTRPGVAFTAVPHGFLRYARFMQQIGLLSKAPASMRDIELPALNGSGN